MRNHQLVGPFASARSTVRSSFTVVVRVAVGMLNHVVARCWVQALSEPALTLCHPA